MINWWFYCFPIVVYFLFKYFTRNHNFWKERGVKGPKPLPLFGNLLDYLRTPLNKLEVERSQKYGKVYGYFKLTQPILTVTDVELLKLITMKDFNCFSNHFNLSRGDPFSSLFLLHLLDDEWKIVRNICNQAFTSKRIREMFPMVNKVVENTVEYINEITDNQKPIHLQKTFLWFAVDVMLNTLYGVQTNSFKDPDGDIARHAIDLFASSNPRVIYGEFMPNFLRVLTNSYAFDPKGCNFFKKLAKYVIDQRKSTSDNNLMNILLKAKLSDTMTMKNTNEEGIGIGDELIVKDRNRKINEEVVLAQCVQLFVAGIETTYLSMTYFLFTMATETEIQQKLFEELKGYFENEKYEYNSLMSLPYLDAVLNETLRHYSPAVQLDRVSSCDYVLGDTGITIPKGTIINIPFYSIHHDPDYWQEPFEFKPERFLPENQSQIKPYTFAPFGYGPRICIGLKLALLELKAIIANLIYRFEVIKIDKTPVEPMYIGKLMTNHCKPIHVLFKNRSDEV